MRVLPVVLLAASTGCSVVKSSVVREDWATVHQDKVKRLTVVVQPPPDGQVKVGEAWARIVRRYVNMKRNFLVRADVTQADPPALEAVCIEGTEAMLYLKPAVTAAGDGFEASVDGKLVKCGEGTELWSGAAGGSFPAKDAMFTEVAANYAREYAPEVERYIPTAMNLLRPLLDTLPNPVITDADMEEKAGVDE